MTIMDFYAGVRVKSYPDHFLYLWIDNRSMLQVQILALVQAAPVKVRAHGVERTVFVFCAIPILAQHLVSAALWLLAQPAAAR
jgi:hypothetical protein